MLFMRSKGNKTAKKINASKKKTTSTQPHEFETMSQVQNRYGSGRKKAGSDGGSGNDGFSNH